MADLVQFSNGANFTKEAFGRGVKILGVSDFKDRLVPRWDEVSEVSPSALRSDRQLLRPGDLLFVRSNGNRQLVGRSLLITPGPKSTHSAFTIRARPDTSKILPRFLAYQMRQAHRVGLMLTASGTNITNLNQTVLGEVPVTVPGLETQAQVVAVLASYDQAIENNLRRIEILEKMAQAVYREWFVNFRFPGHTRVRFTDGADPSLPEGWKLTTLGNVASIVMGQSPRSDFYNEVGEGLPFHQGVGTFGTRFPVRARYTTVTSRMAEKDDVLFSVRAPVGRINVANERLVVGRGLAAITSPRGNPWFLLEQLKDRFQHEDTMGGGTIFKAVTKSDVHKIPFLLPNAEVEEEFDRTVEPMARLIENLSKQNDNLRATRDFLLPRLISGEVDVSELDIDTSWLAA